MQKSFRPDINGLRAWAVVAVLLFHFRILGFSGGFIGVDVFFVISGFLMTRIIHGGLAENDFTLRSFYAARARRIVPALSVLCFAALVIGWVALMPDDYVLLSKHVISVLAFVSNFYFWKESGYFDVGSNENLLLHTWSLSVEWQFYLLFPLYLMTVRRLILGKRRLFVALGAAALISLCLCIVLSPIKPTSAFYLLPTRAWELLAGGLVYCATRETAMDARLARWLEFAGFALVIGSIGLFAPGKQAWPGWYALVPVIGTSMVMLAARRRSIFTSSSVAQWIGLRSYSIYLWHWPVSVSLTYFDAQDSWPAIALGIGASIALGAVSYGLIEKRIDRLHDGATFLRMPRPTVLAPAITILVAGTVWASAGIPARVGVDIATIEANLQPPRRDQGWCFYDVDSDASASIGDAGLKCQLGNASGKVKVLLFGDSFASQYEPLWAILGQRMDLAITVVTTNYCFPALHDEWIAPPASVRGKQQCAVNRKFLRENLQKFDVIVYGGLWGDVVTQGYLPSVVEVLDRSSESARLVVVMAAPRAYDSDIGFQYKNRVLMGQPFDIRHYSSKRDLPMALANGAMEEEVMHHDNAIFIRRADLFKPEGLPEGMDEDHRPFSLDGAHISLQGSRSAAEIFLRTAAYTQLAAKVVALRTPVGSR